jgi:hypothetical protein
MEILKTGKKFSQWGRKFRKSVRLSEIGCFRRSGYVFGQTGSDSLRAVVSGLLRRVLWRGKAVRLAQVKGRDFCDATVEEYEGRAIRILAWIWNGTASRFGLSEFSEAAVEYLRGQEHGISEDDSRSENGLHRSHQRWSTTGERERFVFREGEPRCFRTSTCVGSGTETDAIRKSPTADLSEWSNTRRIKKLEKRFEILDGLAEEI